MYNRGDIIKVDNNVIFVCFGQDASSLDQDDYTLAMVEE